MGSDGNFVKCCMTMDNAEDDAKALRKMAGKLLRISDKLGDRVKNLTPNQRRKLEAKHDAIMAEAEQRGFLKKVSVTDMDEGMRLANRIRQSRGQNTKSWFSWLKSKTSGALRVGFFLATLEITALRRLISIGSGTRRTYLDIAMEAQRMDAQKSKIFVPQLKGHYYTRA